MQMYTHSDALLNQVREVPVQLDLEALVLLLSGGASLRNPCHVAASLGLGTGAALALVHLHALVIRCASQRRLDLTAQAAVQLRVPCLGLQHRNSLKCRSTSKSECLLRRLGLGVKDKGGDSGESGNQRATWCQLLAWPRSGVPL